VQADVSAMSGGPSRFTSRAPCPICEGHEGLPRGRGTRCHGYLDPTGEYARCSREEKAGDLPLNQDGTYSHRLQGGCGCGHQHGAADGTGRGREEPESLIRHTVRAADGTPLAVHCRRGTGEGKRVWWEDPDGALGLGGLRAADLLYGLERLAGAPVDGPVFFTEGEVAADALVAIGLAAVASVTGAGSVGAPHAIGPSAAEMLAGRRLALWPDADAVGAAHMEENAAVLHAAGAGPIVMLDWPEAPAKGDAADLVAGRTRSEALTIVRDLTAAAISWTGDPANLGSSGRTDGGEPAHGWADPVPLEVGPPPPAFPVEVLPAVVRDMVAGVAEATQTALDLPALQALGVLSAAVGGRAEVELSAGWSEPVNLYLAPVAAPGEGKSPALAHLRAPLEERERERFRALRSQVDQARALRRVDDRRRQAAEREAAAAEDAATREEAEERLRDLADRLAAPAPEFPRLLAGGDTTPEALARLMATAGGCIAIVSDEGGLFDRLAGLYSRNVANLDLVLQAWSGQSVRIERVGSEPIYLARPILTLLLCLQPVVVERILRDPVMAGRGVPARFLFAWPPSRLGARRYPAPGLLPAVADAWAALIRDLSNPYLTCAANALAGSELERQRRALEEPPARLGLTESARAAHAGFAAAVEARLGEGSGDLHDLSGWAGKLPGQVARLAGLLHLADRDPDLPDPLHRPVSGEAMGAACALGEYFIAHALKVFGPGGGPWRRANRLKALLETKKWRSLTVREAWHALRTTSGGAFPDTAAVASAVARLEELGWVRRRPDAQRSGSRRGRSPSPEYDVHPTLSA
jgi:hypothetical protein